MADFDQVFYITTGPYIAPRLWGSWGHKHIYQGSTLLWSLMYFYFQGFPIFSDPLPHKCIFRKLFELPGRVVGRSEIPLAERDADSGEQNVSGSAAAVRFGNRFAKCPTVRPSWSRDVRWTARSIAKCRPGQSGTSRVVAAEGDSST